VVEILTQRGVEFDAIEYLKTPLSSDDLSAIVAAIDDPPATLVRKDKHFKELGLNADDYRSEAQVIAVLLEHPRLMERPVAMKDGKGVIGRPSEKVEALLD
jgi:arsenate reductase